MEEVLVLNHIKYSSLKKRKKAGVIQNASGIFKRGKIYTILGSSRTEKSVLLSLMAGLAQPESGEILFKGRNITAAGANFLTERKIGLMLQEFKLIKHLTAFENLVLQLEINSIPRSVRKKTALDLFEKVDFEKARYKVRASKLSYYEQQMVMLLRVISSEPELLLVETGEWNEARGLEGCLTKLIGEAVYKAGACAIISTDCKSIANMADEVWGLKNGILLPIKT